MPEWQDLPGAVDMTLAVHFESSGFSHEAETNCPQSDGHPAECEDERDVTDIKVNGFGVHIWKGKRPCLKKEATLRGKVRRRASRATSLLMS